MTQAYSTDIMTGSAYQEPAVLFDQGMSLKDVEKSVILETLKRQKFNRTRTARVLGIGIRTLQRKLKQYREADGSCVLELKVQ